MTRIGILFDPRSTDREKRPRNTPQVDRAVLPSSVIAKGAHSQEQDMAEFRLLAELIVL